MPYAGKRKRGSSSGGRPVKRFNQGRVRRFTKKRGMASMIKRVMLKQCETKHKSHSFQDQQMFHNTVSIPLNGLVDIAQGDGENQRTGDEIIGKYIKVKLWVSNKLDRPNVMYRFMVIRVPTGEETGSVNPFEGVIGNKMLDYINTEKYTPVFQKYMTLSKTVETGDTAKEQSGYCSFMIPLNNQKIKFLPTGDTPKYQKFNLRLLAVAYDAYGTLVADDIASFAGVTRTYYKDP